MLQELVMAEKATNSQNGGKDQSLHVKEKQPIVTDDELDSILDDALKDFSKPDIMDDPLHGQAKAASLKPSTSHPEGAYALNEEDFANMFSEEGLAKMTEELSKAFSDFATMNPDHLGGATSTDGQSDAGKEQSLEDNLERAWKSMTQNLKDAKEVEPNDYLDQEFMNAMKGLGINDADASPENLMSMMQGMMTNLLSKDILYPSLKEIQMRYPTWLADNKSKLSDDEYTRFTMQQELVSRVCLEFESEKEDDSDAVKKARTEKIMDFMQNMQQYGQPPVDILGQMEGDGSLGSEHLNLDPSKQCVCM